MRAMARFPVRAGRSTQRAISWLLAPLLVATGLMAFPPAASGHGFGSGASTNPLLLEALVLAFLGYVWLASRVDRHHPLNPWPARRTASFTVGLAIIGLALLSPIDVYADDLLSVHMLQHLLLAMVAPPFLVASSPMTLLLRASSASFRQRRLLPLLHHPVVRILSHPIVTWVVFVVAMWTIHFSPLFDAALRDPLLHDAEHVAFLTSGLLFSLPLFGSDPLPHRLGPGGRIVYLLAAMPPMSLLGMVLATAPTLLYPSYLPRLAVLGIAPQADQSFGGAVMWLGSDAAMLVMAALVVAAGEGSRGLRSWNRTG
jgi:putative membrane protein